MKKISFLLLGAATTLLYGQNEVFNGDFQLGTAGYVQKRVIRPDTNPTLEFLALSVENGALKIANPYQERFEIHGKEFYLKPNTEYVFRVKAKTDQPGVPFNAVLYNVTPAKWNSTYLAKPLAKEYQTFETVYRTPPEGGAFHFKIRPDLKHPVQAFTIWVDKIELFEKGTSPDSPAECAMTVPESVYVKEETKSIPLTVQFHNPGKASFAGKGKVLIKEQFSGKTVFEHPVSMELPSGGKKSFSIDIPAERYGTFQAVLEMPGMEKQLGGIFSVIGKYTAGPIDPDKEICVGFNGAIYVDWYPTSPNKGLLVRNAPVETYPELLAAMGCRLLREHDAGYEVTSWYLLENEKDKWDFSLSDYRLGLYEKYNIKILANLGRFNPLQHPKGSENWAQRQWPDWVLPLCRKVTDFPPYVWSVAKERGVLQAPEELWRNYVRNVAEHYKGRITHYEILNEANGYMSAEDYLVYCKSAYEEIKKADPAAKVVGLCVTSDLGAPTDRFTGDFLKAGDGKYMDIASLHPYSARELSSINPADVSLQKFRKQVQNFPVWNSELYYIYDDDKPQPNRCNPDQVAARFLIDLGEGLAQSIALHEAMVFTSPLLPDLDKVHKTEANCEWVPNANFVALNFLARHLEGGKITGKYKPDPNVAMYAFRRKNGELMAACWNAMKREGLKGDFSGLEVTDVFGNPVKSGPLPVTAEMLYLFPGKLSETDFLKKIAALPVTQERAITVGESGRIVDGKAYFTLYNHSAEALPVKAGFHGGGFTATGMTDCVVPANGRISVSVPVKALDKDKSPAQVRILVQGAVVGYPIQMERTEKTLQLPGKITLPNGEIAMRMEKDFLNLSVKVADATDSGSEPDGREMWEQDCIEFFFDLAPGDFAERYSGTYTADTFRLFYQPRLAPEKRLAGWFKPESPIQLKDIQMEETNDAQGYAVMLKIPAKFFGPEFGFDLKINDAKPGEKAHSATSWTSNSERHANRCLFGMIKI